MSNGSETSPSSTADQAPVVTTESSTHRRIAAITRHLAPSPCAVSTKAKVMQELAHERARASFPVRRMTHFLDGGERRTVYREDAMKLLEQFPELNVDARVYDLSMDEQRALILRKVRRMYQLFMEHGADIQRRNIMADVFGIYDFTWYVRNGVHFGLYIGALMSQADAEQQDEFLTPAMMLENFGSFSMTELGHGSHTRGLETTATYSRETDEFIIHTPTDSATKWWIGAAAHTATHTVCFAQLIIDGESKGLQSFVVPLRDLQTHEALPGIRIGDCGSKMGLQGVDNGWIQFDNVRIPRRNMLRRYAHVTRQGEFIQTHKPQLAYSALIGTRGKLVMLSNGIMKKALIIAIRYSAIRRQGVQVSSADPHDEAKLLSYQIHQYRLMPYLAKAFAYHLQTSYIETLIEKFDLEGANLSTALMADIHGTMAGLKAFCTWDTLACIEECRQCCGGHGFSSYNGLSRLLSDFSVMVTFEGDNTVMAQQTASYLSRSVETLRKGAKLAGSVQYLESVATQAKDATWRVQSKRDLEDWDVLSDALVAYAGKTVWKVAQQMDEMNALYASNPQEAWNHCQVDWIEAARVHVFYNVATRFIAQMRELEQQGHPDRALVPVLATLCRLYILQEFDRSGMVFLLKQGFVTSTQCELVHQAMLEACERVRLDAVPLVDSFNFTDLLLNSCIGKADGNVYQHVLDVAQRKQQRASYYESSIKPMLEGNEP
ncbi:TPA: hypothetical protein N0F65_000048 [Lagenidium giganteum]|uniref:Acyl-coenzyme A oxidase n=1 Tax=Lagenidium giganteum TaxID=4803 RepID=A0AAV2YRW6_9STRA|nr:TPA: hypothetical protein N0F65_000048 [Lagenidium giganteum]